MSDYRGDFERDCAKAVASLARHIDPACTPNNKDIAEKFLRKAYLAGRKAREAESGISLTAKQLYDALLFVNPDYLIEDAELLSQRDDEITIAWAPERVSDEGETLPDGLYAYLTECPEEGCYGPLDTADEDLPFKQARDAQAQPVATEMERLRDIERHCWQLMEGMCENEDGTYTLDGGVSKGDIEALNELLPEDHPENEPSKAEAPPVASSIADDIESCDWSLAPIGNKAILHAACAALRAPKAEAPAKRDLDHASKDAFNVEKLFLRYARDRHLNDGSHEYNAALSAFCTAYQFAAPAGEVVGYVVKQKYFSNNICWHQEEAEGVAEAFGGKVHKLIDGGPV